jgi:Fe-S-cluster containining protein
MTDAPWYKDGLCFTCTQCGNCCSGPPGFVWVNEDEVRQISRFLGQPVEDVALDHLRNVGNKVSLRERANGDCTFLDPQTRRCTIYAARPRQCRTWPFWQSNLSSPEAWREVQQVCPGAGRGELHSVESIEAQSAVVRL